MVAREARRGWAASGFRMERKEGWLSGMDSNHDKLLQRELCYHYTTGQTEGGDC